MKSKLVLVKIKIQEPQTLLPGPLTKTLFLKDIIFRLCHLSEDYAIANVPFNFYYSAEMTQKILEKPLEKKAGKNYGPPGNKKLVLPTPLYAQYCTPL